MTVLRPGEHPDELISASLTGDLSVAEQQALEAHMADCARCRETLAAFGEERRLISGMRHVAPPRDLSARVRAGIESGRLGGLPWWRRPAFLGIAGGVATVAAAVLAIVVLANQQDQPPVAQGTPSPMASVSTPSQSVEPSASVAPSEEPIPTPTVNPQAFLRPGELGYFSMTGGSLETPKLTFIKNATGEAIEAETPTGPPIAAALSPDAEWIAYITEVGETGANQVWVLHLTDGETVRLGCALAGPFADRLLWSANSRYLAYTLRAVDLGETIDCGPMAPGPADSTDVWVFDTESGEVTRVTDTGDAFAAAIEGNGLDNGTALVISHAAETPWTEFTRLAIPPDEGTTPARVEGVFLPLVSPTSGLMLYWSGSMSQATQDGAWHFTTGGLPMVGNAADLTVAGTPDGTPLFADLSGRGGDGFADGHFSWGADGDLVAFWGGLWTGSPQGEDYPSELAAYAGRLTDGGLTMHSRLAIPTDADTARIISVAFEPDGVSVVVSVGDASAGVGDPSSANLYRVSIGAGEAVKIGGAIDPPPWNGPAVFGPEPGSPF